MIVKKYIKLLLIHFSKYDKEIEHTEHTEMKLANNPHSVSTKIIAFCKGWILIIKKNVKWQWTKNV